MQDETLHTKIQKLRGIVEGLGPCAVAFSAGVDSTLLLAVAHEVAGKGCMAITASTPAHTARELDEARAFCTERGIRHEVFETDQLKVPGLDHNPPDRCYLCKRHLFAAMAGIARDAGHPALMEGSNVDDQVAYRPGFAAVQELGVSSPLLEVGMTKEDVRAASKLLGLPTFDKPSTPCLLTRLPYGQLVTRESLKMVEDAENLVAEVGVATLRVRMDGTAARIEVMPEDFPALLDEENRAHIVEGLGTLGFTSVALDLRGYHANDPTL